jgi:hypothetical protein
LKVARNPLRVLAFARFVGTARPRFVRTYLAFSAVRRPLRSTRLDADYPTGQSAVGAVELREFLVITALNPSTTRNPIPYFAVFLAT